MGMKVIIVLFAVFALQGCQSMKGASTILLVADWKQTKKIISVNQETNPILKNASSGQTDRYFTAAIIANYFIGEKLLTGENRRAYYCAVITLQSFVVLSNLNYGYEIRF